MQSRSYAYNDHAKTIDHIQFTILGNKEIKRGSAFPNSSGLDIPDLYDNMEPKRGGLIDRRMGVNSKDDDCETCGLGTLHCPGHYGHTDLVDPTFHIGFLDQVKKILGCVCLKCSKLLIYKNEEEMLEAMKNKNSRTRLAEIKAIAKNVSYCQKPGYGCGTPVSTIKKEIKKATCEINLVSETNFTGVQTEGGDNRKKKIRQILTPEICYNILKNISDVDCKILGFDTELNRPEDLIIQTFIVPPVSMRPSVKADYMSSSTMEDDLTHKIADIIKSNIRARKFKETLHEGSQKFIQDHNNLLQYNVATYMDNETISMPKCEQRGKVTRSLFARHPTKQGRYRGNLLGKRVNFSGRTVITPDASLDMDQLGVPIMTAMTLTYPEIVTESNIERLQKLVDNGKYNYPGANFVFPGSRKDRKPIYLGYRKEQCKIRFGDTVERHLVDNDYVLLNRQPTLHKLSMMGHRVKVLRDPNLRTYRLNVSVTTPYNADFDGDEMNIHVPQSEQTKIELSHIANSKLQIVSPRTSESIIGVVQDGLIGAFNLTSSSTVIDWKDAMNILSYTTVEDVSSFVKKRSYTGLEMFSAILPDRVTTNGQMTVKNGTAVKGQVSKKQLGSGANNSLIHHIWDIYGPDKTVDFINNIQRLTNNFNLVNGFTVGIGDGMIKSSVEKELHKCFETMTLKVDHLVTEIENNPALYDSETFESALYGETNVVRDTASKLIMQNLKEDNNFNIMISSGAKGKPINMGQMSGCVGQQSLEGARIKKKVNGRTLAYFHQNDDSAVARGFVQQPYIHGVNPREFILHNLATREGLIDTAIKTSASGYIQRKLIKLLEDCKVMYDMTVRTSNNIIMQFCYGDSGIDTTKQAKQKLESLMMGNKAMAAKYKLSAQELKNHKNFSEADSKKHFNSMLKMRDVLRESALKRTLNYIFLSNEFMLPVNIPRLLSDIDNIKEEAKKDNTKLHPEYVLQRLDEVVEYKNTQLLAISKSDASKGKSLKFRDEQVYKTLFRYVLQEYLSPKIAIYDLKLSKNAFDILIDRIIKIYNKSVVESGEMVGVIAGQSTGEPVTQLSCERNTKIDICVGKMKESYHKSYHGTIGDFIDQLLEKNSSDVVDIGNDSVVLDLKENYSIVGVSDNEKTSWRTISQVSRHPANGGLVRVTTESGRSTTATLSHSFLMRSKQGTVVPIKGSDLKIGDRVPIVMKTPDAPDMPETLSGPDCCLNDKITGSGMGANSLRRNSPVNRELVTSTSTCIEGYLVARLTSSTYKCTRTDAETLCVLLSRLDIFASPKHLDDRSVVVVRGRYTDRFIKMFVKENRTKEMYRNSVEFVDSDELDMIPEMSELVISTADLLDIKCNVTPNTDMSRDELNVWYNVFVDKVKDIKPSVQIEAALVQINSVINNDVVWDKIVDLEILEDPKEFVYDFTVPGNDSFSVDNGVLVHNTLNTFHYAGIGSMGSANSGVPRVNEILSATKNIKTPQTKIYLEDNVRRNEVVAKQISNTVKFANIATVRQRLDVYYDPNPMESEGFMKEDNVLNPYYKSRPTKNSCQKSIKGLPWLIRIVLDKEVMIEKGITLLDIKTKFCDFWEHRYAHTKGIKKEDKKILEKIQQCAVLSNSNNDTVPVIHIRFDMADFNFSTITGFIEIFVDNLKLKGVTGVNKILGVYETPTVDMNNEDQTVEQYKELVIVTSGINMDRIRYINGINVNKTTCNDIVQTFHEFGIEAARALILLEMNIVFKTEYVNYQHLSMLCEIMTNPGFLASIDRHGIGKLDVDPYQQASLERPVLKILEAAMYGEVDSVRSVASRIITGQVVKGGTGMCDLFLNTDMIEKSEYVEDADQQYVQTYNELDTDTVMNDIIDQGAEGMFVPM